MNVRFMTFSLLLLTVLGAAGRAWSAEMNAWLDRTRISEGETVRLTLEAPGQISGRPDTAPLEQDFEVLGLSTGSRVNIVNGRTDASTTWTLTLSPRRPGTLTLPALRVGNHRSEPLPVEVAAAPAPASGRGSDILIETEIEPRNPYVQAQVVYTIRLLHAVPITGGRLSEPESENTLVQRLGEDREYGATRNGRRYQVVERSYALFPQTSGPLELPAPVFSGEMPDGRQQRASPFQRFFGNDPLFSRDPFEDLMTPTRPVRVRGEPARLEVRPRPNAARGVHWLPAQRLKLEGEWQPDAAGIHSGEPVTLVLHLEAEGLTGGQLPSLAPEAVEDFKVFPDQAQRRTDAAGAGVTGYLQQKIAFLPERTGKLALPAIEVRWWDTQADRERIATLPGRVVEVAPVPGQAVRQTPDRVPSAATRDAAADRAVADVSAHGSGSAASPSMPWPWISAVLAAGWLVTLVFWWRRDHRLPSAGVGEEPKAVESPAPAAARRRFLAACRAGDASSAQRWLLAWAAVHWPTDPPRGLEALAHRIRDPEAREALARLNRALYKEPGPWDGMRLATCLTQLPEPRKKAGKGNTVLAPLYPDRAR